MFELITHDLPRLLDALGDLPPESQLRLVLAIPDVAEALTKVAEALTKVAARVLPGKGRHRRR
jgi:hypothetical protein